MLETIKDQYRERAATFSKKSAGQEARYNRLAFVRLAVFLAGVAVAIFLWAEYWPGGLAFTFLFLAGFIRFVRWHQDIRRRQRHNEHLARVNETEKQVLAYSYGDLPAGSEFLEDGHAYSLDLDVFGPYSFFQYCNRAVTSLGREQLAGWLREAAESEEIAVRQQAVAELRDHLDWRQHFRAYGMECEDDPGHLRLLRSWLSDPDFVRNRSWLVAALYLAPFWSLGAILLWIFVLPWQIAVLLFLPQAWILRKTLVQVNETHRHTTQAGEVLDHYARLIRHIEVATFESPRLRTLTERFHEGATPASGKVRRLSYIISQLNVRYNVFAIVLNVLGLWDLQWVYRLERWKEAHRTHLPGWFEALAQFEALASFGNLFYNNPDWTMPLLHEREELTALGIGHPLIPPAQRVTNDLQMPTRAHIKLITGSNMAGKSTFLRTVGLNIALAMAGAPVCARRLALPPLSVYTSMRTQDALHESTSSFYAELKRLKFIIEAVEAGERVFFLLDEILKGTNSRDRHTGAKALIRQLIRSKGGGLIATHDLELGKLEAEAGGAIENLCIEVEIRDGELFFDYKLKKGVSRSFNATLLMQRMGIRIEGGDQDPPEQ